MSRPILEVSGLSMRFGGLLAVNGVSLSVNEKPVSYTHLTLPTIYSV